MTLALVVLPLLTAGFWRLRGERQLDQVEREIAAEKVREGLVTRVPLFGDPIDGRAWDHYAAAVLSLDQDPDPTREHPFEYKAGVVPAFPFPLRETLAGLREAASSRISDLFRGLQCTRLGERPSTEWYFKEKVGKYLLIGAEALRLEGRDAEALRWTAALAGLIQDYRIGLDLGAQEVTYEVWAFMEWNTVLASHSLSAKECEELCGLLDRLEGLRVSMIDRIRAECFLRREDAVDYANGSDDLSPWPDDPGWKHLWSRRLLACDAVGQINSDEAALARICGLPLHERETAMDRFETSLPKKRLSLQKKSHGFQAPCDASHFRDDTCLREFHQTARLSTALAWYESERGKPPATLQDLVPRYVSTVSPRPTTGTPPVYKDGVLRSIGWTFEGEADWTVRRR